jgi:hypothetical protein
MKTLPENSIPSRSVTFESNGVHLHPLGAWDAPSSSSIIYCLPAGLLADNQHVRDCMALAYHHHL